MSEASPEGPRVVEHGTRFLVGFKQRGQLFNSFTLTPPKGKLRREFTNAISGGYAKMRMVALRHILQSLGDLDPMPVNAASLIQSIPIPDADMIDFFATYHSCGGRLDWTSKCPACEAEIETSVDLGQVRIVPGTQTPEFDEQGRPYMKGSFLDPASGKNIEVTFRVPTMLDQQKFMEKTLAAGDNSGDAVFNNFLALMHSYDGGPPLTTVQLDELPMPTVDALLDMTKQHRTAGIDTDVALTCPKCHREVTIDLPLDQWLHPFVNRKQS